MITHRFYNRASWANLVLTGSYFSWRASSADLNLPPAPIRHECWAPGNSCTCLLCHSRTEINVIPESSPASKAVFWPHQHVEMWMWWLKTNSDLTISADTRQKHTWIWGASFCRKAKVLGRLSVKHLFSFQNGVIFHIVDSEGCLLSCCESRYPISSPNKVMWSLFLVPALLFTSAKWKGNDCQF